MKNILILIAFVVSLSACGNKEHSLPLGEKIVELKSIYAPDKRTSIFNVDFAERGGDIVLKGETQFPAAKDSLINFLINAGRTYVDSVELLPSQDLSGEHFGIVRLPVCNIRSLPKHSAELSTQSTMGSVLRIWKRQGDWFLVQTPDNYLGWLDIDGFYPMRIDRYRQWINAEKSIVTGDFSNAYERPDQTSQKVSVLIKGNIVKASDRIIGAFRQIELPDGRSGYVLSTDLTPVQDWLDAQDFEADELINTAKEFMGTPYLWGGTSQNGFDCSGFTKTVFYLNGLLLPRDASQQVTIGVDLGTKIDFDKWKPGDLLFFGKKSTSESKERITHVSIYMGDGKMIHSAGNVKIESLRRGDNDFSPLRYESFVRAKRVLDVPGDNGIYALRTLEEFNG